MAEKYNGMPMRFAHTGVTQLAPENTKEAFCAAVAMGCEGIEIDINMSLDGEIIVTHNATLGKMTHGAFDGTLREMTAAEIQKVDIPFRDSFRPKYPPYPWTESEGGKCVLCAPEDPECRVTHLMTFREFDRWLTETGADITVEVEFKVPGMCPSMDEVLKTSENVSKYIFFSGDRVVLEDMQYHYRRVGKPEGLRFGANIRHLNADTMAFIQKCDLWEVGLNNEAFTREDVDLLSSMGIRVFSNLGDYPEWWAQLAPLGVTGFKTNYPEAYTEWWAAAQGKAE